MKKICSFDVGIKHLPFCIMDQMDGKIYIKTWKMLDISEPKLTCCGILKNKSICGKIAKLCGGGNAYCDIHKGQYNPPEFSEEDVKTYDGKNKCMYTHKKSCDKVAKFMINQKYYCNTHLKSIKNGFIKDNSLKKIKRHNCATESLTMLGQKMFELLDKNPEILDVDTIVIENQPSLKNPRMKTISMFLYSYFIMRGIMKIGDGKSTIKCIDFVAPSGKLKINDILSKKILSMCKTKQSKYDTTKELGIIYCNELLKLCKNYDALKKILESNKKQDDLADAFLHAYYYLYGSVGLEDKKFIDMTINYFKDKLENVKKPKNIQIDKI